MLTDPQSVTINAIANSLPRTTAGVDSGNFTKDDGNIKLSVKHTYGSRFRRLIRLDNRKIASDPLSTGYNKEYSMACYLVIDVPSVGYSLTEQKQIVDGLVGWLSASTGANLAKVLGGEA